jgi:hypothetical protein
MSFESQLPFVWTNLNLAHPGGGTVTTKGKLIALPFCEMPRRYGVGFWNYDLRDAEDYP